MKKPVKNNLIIELHVPDLRKAKDFYSELGFKVSLEDEPNEEELGYLTMVRKDRAGDTLINFYGGDDRVYDQSFFGQFPRNTKRGYEISITIVTSDIEKIYHKVQTALKSNIVREMKKIKDHEHEWKDFRMVDPFGFYLRFTELVDWGQK